MKKKQSYKKKSSLKKGMIIVILLMFSLGIGYGAVISTVNILGSASAMKYGGLFIETVVIADNNGVTENMLPIYDDPVLATDLNFSNNNYSFITYSVTIANGGDNIEKYTGESFNVLDSIKSIIDYEIAEGLSIGGYLMPGESTTFELTYQYKAGATAGDYNLEMIFNFEDCGSFYANNTTITGNLTGNTRVTPIDVHIINRNNSQITYSFALDDDKFKLTDSKGKNLNAMIAAANSDTTVTIYVSKVTNTVYYTTTYDVGLSITYNSMTSYLNDITITTDITTGPQDTTIPQIGEVTFAINNTVGTFDVNWSRTDTGGSDIVNYFVKLYNASNVLIADTTIPGDITTYRYTNQNPNTYYAVVYGVDEAGNSGEDYCASATTTTTDCRKSNNTEMRWARTVTYNLTNLSHNGASTVNLGQTLSFTLSASSNYTLPTSITVNMNGTALTTGYTYTSSSGAVSIPNVTGDITITAAGVSSGCLVKGTKIRLADGKIKKIEDIRYDDLLLVWNYETGQFDYTYPIWIEKGRTTEQYQIATLSDGTTLKTVGYHGVFSTSDNMFVTVDKKDQFKVGTTILKVDKNNKFYPIKVAKIEIINKPVTFYQVISTKYFNIVSDDVLTTDGTLMFSNLYGFKENVVWPSLKNKILSDPNNLYKYEELSDVFPRYMFEGMRAAEAKFLVNNNYFTKDTFIKYFKGNLLDSNMLLNPTMINGNRMWMVTTSDDKYLLNKDRFLRKEGSCYTLKEPIKQNNKTFIGWYEPSTCKYYQPNDKVQIWYGLHFKAVWK